MILWGVLDTVDNVWMGTPEGPKTYPTKSLALVAGQVMEQQLGWTARLRPALFREMPNRMRDEIPVKITVLQALDNLEKQGRIEPEVRTQIAAEEPRLTLIRGNQK